MTRALIFDCDGVLADTERDGHLAAFNQMWREQGVNWQWSLAQYAEKVKIGGGKERMASLGRDDDFRAVYPVPESAEEWGQYCSRLAQTQERNLQRTGRCRRTPRPARRQKAG